jgi:hypothetical protein
MNIIMTDILYVEVYLRLQGPEYSEKFEALANAMNFFYKHGNVLNFVTSTSDIVTQVDLPLVGKLYAAQIGGGWDRVLVEEIIPEGLILVVV